MFQMYTPEEEVLVKSIGMIGKQNIEKISKEVALLRNRQKQSKNRIKLTKVKGFSSERSNLTLITNHKSFQGSKNEINKSFNLNDKEKRYVSIFKEAIANNHKHISNYKDCIRAINKEFFLTTNTVLNDNQQYQCITEPNNKTDDDPRPKVKRETIQAIRERKKDESLQLKHQQDLIKIQEKFAIAKARRERVQRRFRLLKNCVRYLVSNGIKLQTYIENNPFPIIPYSLRYSEDFITAAKFNNLHLIKEALEKDNAYIYEYDYYKQTAFHWAAKLGNVEVLQYLLSKGKCCNVYDDKLRTPLFLAALNNHYDCCKMLIENKGNLHFNDVNGDKPVNVTTDPKLKLYLQLEMEKDDDYTQMDKQN